MTEMNLNTVLGDYTIINNYYSSIIFILVKTQLIYCQRFSAKLTVFIITAYKHIDCLSTFLINVILNPFHDV